MKTFPRLLLASVLLLVIPSCTQEKTVPTAETPLDQLSVPVKVDLQYGFENRQVSVLCNQELCFEAALGPSVPLAGPIASFTTSLPRDANRIRVLWRLHAPGSPSQADSTNFQLGLSNHYYLGLRLLNDSLVVAIQDSAFLYL